MAENLMGSIASRLGANMYEVDEASHISVDQEAVAAAGIAPLLVRICPAHVYSLRADGTLGVDHAGCLECGTCLAVSKGAISWHYPESGMGIIYREG